MPALCAEVFFVRHNGGSVWFDELRWPWPKHGCFDEDRYGIQLRRLLTEHRRASGQVFGVIIETETTWPGEGGRIVVRCNDGTLIDQEFDTKANLSLLPGRLVVVLHGEQGELSLQFVNSAQRRLIAYLQIIENRIGRVVEEFAYRRKAEAEQRLSALSAQHPAGIGWRSTSATSIDVLAANQSLPLAVAAPAAFRHWSARETTRCLPTASA